MATTSYLTLAEFKDATVLPEGYADAVEASEADWTLAKLTFLSGYINARLAKRYAVPFVAPIPPVILDWLERLASWAVLLKRGCDPTDQQTAEIKERATLALAEIREAADSKEGLFELPLRDDTSADGISKGFVQGYSEASPYTWTQIQLEAAEAES
jgi:hypothetical protein